jgi:thiol-disulfide isomerase/thioredoxin
MRRREAIAGITSLGVLGGAGVVALRGFPSPGESSDSAGKENSGVDPITVETLDAPGSTAGSVQIPAQNQPVFIDFFGTWCPPCIDQMPRLRTANERIGDSVLFISVTTEAVGRVVTKEEVVNWWRENDGNWLLGIDPTTELAARYNPTGYPYAVAMDATGTVRWSGAGLKSADDIVAGIETALDNE